MEVHTEIWWERLASFSSAFFRLALGASFLSAVADRFGLWGQFGQPNVSWGNFARFVEYTGRLNWFLPHPIVSALAVIVTFAEVLLGLLLLVGWKTRITALCAGILVMIFGMAMTAALGVEAPLSASVFSAAGGSLLLATCTRFPFSVDELIQRACKRKEARTDGNLLLRTGTSVARS